jgi:hypothetical protein
MDGKNIHLTANDDVALDEARHVVDTARTYPHLLVTAQYHRYEMADGKIRPSYIVVKVDADDAPDRVIEKRRQGLEELNRLINKAKTDYANTTEGRAELRVRRGQEDYKEVIPEEKRLVLDGISHQDLSLRNPRLLARIQRNNRHETLIINSAKAWAKSIEYLMEERAITNIGKVAGSALAMQLHEPSRRFRHIAIAVLEKTWRYGEDLAAWHQKKFRPRKNSSSVTIDKNGVIHATGFDPLNMVYVEDVEGALNIRIATREDLAAWHQKKFRPRKNSSSVTIDKNGVIHATGFDPLNMVYVEDVEGALNIRIATREDRALFEKNTIGTGSYTRAGVMLSLIEELKKRPKARRRNDPDRGPLPH